MIRFLFLLILGAAIGIAASSNCDWSLLQLACSLIFWFGLAAALIPGIQTIAPEKGGGQ